MSSIIVLDSSDEETTETPVKVITKEKEVVGDTSKKKINSEEKENDDISNKVKRKLPQLFDIENDKEGEKPPPVKRIKPIPISKAISPTQNLNLNLNNIKITTNGDFKERTETISKQINPTIINLDDDPLEKTKLPTENKSEKGNVKEEPNVTTNQDGNDSSKLEENGTETKMENEDTNEEKKSDDKNIKLSESAFAEKDLNPVFVSLLSACRAADPSSDMEALIHKKLIKYYHSVHPDFVNSKGFNKTVKAVIAEINAQPNLVYYRLKTIVEELKVRMKSNSTVMCNEDVTTTGNERRDQQIKRLNHALYVLTKRIAKLEAADVDLDDDLNSTYLQVERFKKRACEIYEKICDLTGESKHAHRSVKKPITFKGTSYPEFNRTIQFFVNKTRTFPDFFDILRCLEHCNKQYSFGLKNDEVKKIAQDAFAKIGKSLQDRRKTDLYETATHFTGTSVDPAEVDPDLSAKLAENQKYHSKITNLIDRFAAEQDLVNKERQKPGNDGKLNTNETETVNNSVEEKSNNTEVNKTLNSDKIVKQTDSVIDVDNVIVINNHKSAKSTTIEEQSNRSDEKSSTSCKTQLLKNELARTNSSSTLGQIEEIVISDEEESSSS